MKKVTIGFLIISTIAIISIITYIFNFISGFGAGTLGGFDRISFATSKTVLVRGIDSLFSQNPKYKIPEKWKKFDDWSSRGYDFLDTRIFYFSKEPEEMYYVSFLGDANDSLQIDTTKTSLSIRAIHNGQGWSLESGFSEKEIERIENRLDKEIISKLELFTKTNSIREK